ncbi:MAG: hypothetical protein ACK4V6_01785 [Microthrixaceae bacterium]
MGSAVLAVVIAVGVLTGMVAVVMFFRSLQPDPTDVGPLEELVGGLEVLEEPAQHCPESADSCWGSVVVTSGEGQAATIEQVTRNVQVVGYAVEEENVFGRWEARQGDVCLNLYEPGELRVYDAAGFPSDAMYLSIDTCWTPS